MLHLSGSIGKVTTLGAGLVAHGGMCAIWGSIRGPDDEGRELAIFCDRPKVCVDHGCSHVQSNATVLGSITMTASDSAIGRGAIAQAQAPRGGKGGAGGQCP